MTLVLWFDGALRDPAVPIYRATERGVLVGDGVFETLRVVGGRPFALARHLERLAHSAHGLGIALPPLDELARAVHEVVRADTSVGRVRVTLTAGDGAHGSSRTGAAGAAGAGAAASEALWTVVGTAATVWPPTSAVAVVPWCRNERAATVGLKTTSYADNVIALAYAHERGADEAIFPNTRGELCEGAGSNVFVVLDGELVTPPLSSGCLGGVTRQLVIECTGAREVDLPIEVLGSAAVSEAFLTSTTRDVQPIVRIDDRVLSIGSRSRDAAAAFAALVARDLDP